MAETVSFSSGYNSFVDYTWNDADFTWSNDLDVCNWVEFSSFLEKIAVSSSIRLFDFNLKSFSSFQVDSFLFNVGKDFNVDLEGFLGSIEFVDSKTFCNYSYLKDLVILSDKKVIECNLSLVSALNFTVNKYFNINLKDFCSMFRFDGCLNANIISNFLDSFNVLDDSYFVYNFDFDISFIVADSFSSLSSFNKSFNEKFILDDNLFYEFDFFAEEILRVTENVNAVIYASFLEEFNFIVSLYHIFNFPLICEQFSFGSSLLLEMESDFGETINFTTELLTGCGFVFSNLSIFSKELSLDSLLKFMDRPAGYSNFQEFKVGEYDYKDAIVRLNIKSNNLNFATGIDSLSLHVDIPDTDDRGVSTVSSEITYIKFNKKYYNPPEEVSLSIKGGSTGDVLVPKLIDVDNIGFHCCVLNSSGVMVSAQISWASKGY